MKLERWLLNTQPESFHPTLFHFPSEDSYEDEDVCEKSDGPEGSERKDGQGTGTGDSKKREKRWIGPRRDVSDNITQILNNLAKGYDKRIRPNYGGAHVEVGVTMYVLSISAISEVHMDFTVDFYFRQIWKDPRLQFQASDQISTLSVSTEFLKNIWVPDTFFVNEKSSHFHLATTSNEFLRISQDGDIIRSIRLTVTAACTMDFRRFPMDSQLCTIEIESFGYTMSDIRYKWARGPSSVGVSSDVQLPQFKVVGYRQRTFEISLLTGNYSRLACEILFVRSMGYYLIQIYIPSSLIVIISWVSFWINRNASSARVPLGITTVLTMTTLMSNTNKELPKISYVKSIDIFLGTCFFFVFAALLEYAAVGYVAKRIDMRKRHLAAMRYLATHRGEGSKGKVPPPSLPLPPQNPQSCIWMQPPESRLTTMCRSQQPQPGVGQSGDKDAIQLAKTLTDLRAQMGDANVCAVTPSTIDKYSRIVFPISFISFHLFYWIVYMRISVQSLAEVEDLTAFDNSE